MAATQNFRSAFNGFNREDVVHYIEYMQSKFKSQIAQAKAEADHFQEELDALRATPAEDAALADRCMELEELIRSKDEELETLKELAEQSETRAAQLQKELDEAHAESAAIAAERDALQKKLDEALAKQESEKAKASEELEAYRRAERTERMAQERAEQLCRRTNGIIADASVKVDAAAGQIGELADRVAAELDVLRAAVTGSKQALSDAASAMYAVRTEE